jgi:predicted DCC family thiol-disulfide oxidoreductase YuxK
MGHLTSERFPLLIFFDGECAFCDQWVNRIRTADVAHRIRFGTKQGETFRAVAQQHPELDNVESIVVVRRRSEGSEEYLVRSTAVAAAIQGLTPFRFFSFVLAMTPRPLAELGYRLFSKIRRPLFGRLESCRVPSEDEKPLFVD